MSSLNTSSEQPQLIRLHLSLIFKACKLNEIFKYMYKLIEICVYVH